MSRIGPGLRRGTHPSYTTDIYLLADKNISADVFRSQKRHDSASLLLRRQSCCVVTRWSETKDDGASIGARSPPQCAPDAQAPKSWPLLPDHHSLFVLFVACTRTQFAPRYNHRTLARTHNLTTCGVGPEVGAALRSSGSTSCVAAGCYARRPHVSATTRSATLLEGRLPSRNQCRCCSAMIILRRISTRTLCRYYSRLRLRHHRHIRSRCASYELLCPLFDKLSSHLAI